MGLSLAAVCGFLIAVASAVVVHGLSGAGTSVAAAHGFSSCGPWALEHRLNSYSTRA